MARAQGQRSPQRNAHPGYHDPNRDPADTWETYEVQVVAFFTSWYDLGELGKAGTNRQPTLVDGLAAHWKAASSSPGGEYGYGRISTTPEPCAAFYPDWSGASHHRLPHHRLEPDTSRRPAAQSLPVACPQGLSASPAAARARVCASRRTPDKHGATLSVSWNLPKARNCIPSYLPGTAPAVPLRPPA
jgi:hypothetical protein